MKLEILAEVFKVRTEEADVAKKAIDDKEHNQRIMARIAQKNDEAEGSLTVEQLTDLLRK